MSDIGHRLRKELERVERKIEEGNEAVAIYQKRARSLKQTLSLYEKEGPAQRGKDSPLVVQIADVLRKSDRPMKLAEIHHLLPTAPNKATVHYTLRSNPDLFVRTGHGMYEMKKEEKKK